MVTPITSKGDKGDLDTSYLRTVIRGAYVKHWELHSHGVLSHLIFTEVLNAKQALSSHFAGGETEALRSQEYLPKDTQLVDGI